MLIGGLSEAGRKNDDANRRRFQRTIPPRESSVLNARIRLIDFRYYHDEREKPTRSDEHRALKARAHECILRRCVVVVLSSDRDVFN